MTVGELRKALEGVPDDTEVVIEDDNKAWSGANGIVLCRLAWSSDPSGGRVPLDSPGRATDDREEFDCLGITWDTIGPPPVGGRFLFES